MIPPLLVISTLYFGSTATYVYVSNDANITSPTSPTCLSPLKIACFPDSPSQQLPSACRMNDLDTIDMDIAEDQQQQQHDLEQEMDVGLSLSFADNSSPGQRDGLHLVEE